jgi:sulfotransferase family protein
MGVADSPLRDHVIFVEGAPRSGTTWLVTLLATHPEIAGVEAESHLFDFGVDRLFDNFEHRDPDLHGLQSYLDREELVDLVRDLCDGILLAMRSHVSAATSPEFVVEKTPIAGGTGGLDLARKRECYPDGWYVHIVRDREAVARSLMRAPWMHDRSYEACAGVWDRTVGHARASLGDLPRYREVSYEDLRADPAEGCKTLFAWLGVGTGDDALETIRVLSREQFSDLGAVAAAPARATASAIASAPRRLFTSARAALQRQRNGGVAGGEIQGPSNGLAFTLVRALRERDAETLRSLTTATFEFVYRSADGDLSLRGDDGREALVRMAEDTFTRRYVGEWWASAGGGPGEWWTSAPGKPFWTIFFSALGGEATRVDLAIGLVLEDELVRRAVVISAGALEGRPVVESDPAQS